MERLLRFAGRGPEASPEARARIYAAVNERWREAVGARRNPQTTRVRWRSGATFALAATLAAAAIGMYLLGTPPSIDGAAFGSAARVAGSVEVRRAERSFMLEDGAGLAVGDRVATDSTSRAALTVGDGESLRIDAGTTFEIVATDRIALERGALYLDSDPGASIAGASPALRIETQYGTVQHTGTQYEARLEDSALRVRVREGIVVMRDGGRELVGTRGEELIMPANGSPRRAALGTDDVAWEWVESLAALEERPDYGLLETLEWVARETGASLSFSTPETRARAAATTLRGLGGLSPEAVVESVRGTTRFAVTRSGTELTVADREL